MNKLKDKIYYETEDFTLLLGDTFELLKDFPEKTIDVIFADPPYFLSDGGVTCHSGKQVSVNKAKWDQALTIEGKLKFHQDWMHEPA